MQNPDDYNTNSADSNQTHFNNNYNVHDPNQMNQMNEMNEMNDLNDLNEMNEINEMNDLNDMNGINYGMNVNDGDEYGFDQLPRVSVPYLPPLSNPNTFTLVLDLDETLVHFYEVS